MVWKIPLVMLLGALTLISCKKDKDKPHEEELITTLIMTWAPDGGGDEVTFIWRDLDGEGGNPPVIMTEPLAANTAYTVRINLLDESQMPPEDITDEIEEEDDEHQFFYLPSGIALTVEYLDSDGNGNPIGLWTRMTTGDPSTGSLQVTLRHGPNKSATGVKEGDITNAGGDTDIEVEFDVTIL